MAITRNIVAKKCRFRGKGSGEIGFSVNVNFSGSEVGIGKVVDCGRFSSLNKLVRVTGFVLRYEHNLKAFLSGCEVAKGDLLFEEIKKSKLIWVKYEQYFTKNYTKLKNSLNLFIDSEDVIRCRSRIAEANQLTFNEKCPILLRSDSKFTSLVVLKCHHDIYHCGVQATLCNLRNNYWIVRGRQQIKSILKNCVVCKIIQGKPLAPPETPALPSYRVNCNHAFENTGLDFAGPLYCKGDHSSSGEMYKCYVLLFTCCVTRAVHLE